ncbi:DUF4157 domain-containing protein [Massilia sp. DJPM01]|uniref:eCIS core domain-containing protein n=1 Tax=Massilia sp. DJPM01 TaxID=3024404 RepID=UPI00259DE47A|nr:DUF4157 domain-containing protein [Massilia sp. DJPM01]MDM5175764.1 DUF4157 domain-containing protein [Massilia sp. DJPM01]
MQKAPSLPAPSNQDAVQRSVADTRQEGQPGAAGTLAGPQAERLGQLADLANASAQGALQRRLAGMAQASASARAVNRSGLPHQLKSGIEALSGMSMDQVTVHYNSDRPAQLQALAYAQGTDIHLAPGQEQHLPHEAWHVVQQAQGRVAPTLQMKGGVPVNDDAALEREADTMGLKALQAPQASCGLRPLSLHGRKPVQRIATQVVLGATNTVTVHIVGRPPNAYGASSGDHLTAFSARQFGVVIALNNQNFWQALARLDEFINGIQDMPGFKLTVSMPAAQRAKLLKAWTRMRTLRNDLPSPLELLDVKPDQQVGAFALSQMQELISTYLDVVELIPLSTINVAAKYKAGAGKGKGESAPLGVIRGIESALSEGTEPVVDKDAFSAAFLGLFDASAAALVAAELDQTMLENTGSGFAHGSSPFARVRSMIEHHLVTMYQSFPRTMAKMGDRDVLKADMTKTILPRMLQEWEGDIAFLQKRIAAKQVVQQTQRADLLVQRGNATKQRREIRGRIAAAVEEENSANEQITVIRKYIAELKKDRVGTDALVAPLGTTARQHVTSDDGSKDVDEDEDQQDADEDQVEEEEADAITWGGPAVQVRLDKKDVITDIRFAGRSASPLIGGSMGAHTTSWIAHLDRIRAALVNQRSEHCRDILLALWEEAVASSTRMQRAFSDTSAGEAQRDAALKGFTQHQAGMTSAATPAMRISLLQLAVQSLLNYTNSIPGATLEATDTGGKSEGKARGFLLGYERGKITASARSLKAALIALLDVKVVAPKALLTVVANHLEVVERAYPLSWKASGLGKNAKLTAAKSVAAELARLKSGTFSRVLDVPEADSGKPLTSFDLASFSLGDMGGTKGDKGAAKGASGGSVKAAANADYQYEDVDMYRILDAEVARLALPGITIVPPTDNMHPGQLQQRLSETTPGNRALDRTILVPFNIGNYHWVGIVIVLGRDIVGAPPAIVRYLDPLRGLRSIDGAVLAEIRAVFPGAEVEDAGRVLQIDGTSCGPLTIVNLLRQGQGQGLTHNVVSTAGYTAALREQHIALLENVQPGANFRARQSEGGTVSSSFDSARYLGKKLTYTRKGTERIVAIAHTIRTLPDPVRQPIQTAFAEIAKLAKNLLRDVSHDYALLRKGFTGARLAVNALGDGNPARELFATLMTRLWGAEPSKFGENFNHLKIADFDELMVIIGHVLGTDDLAKPLAALQEGLKIDEAEVRKLADASKK